MLADVHSTKEHQFLGTSSADPLTGLIPGLHFVSMTPTLDPLEDAKKTQCHPWTNCFIKLVDFCLLLMMIYLWSQQSVMF